MINAIFCIGQYVVFVVCLILFGPTGSALAPQRQWWPWQRRESLRHRTPKLPLSRSLNENLKTSKCHWNDSIRHGIILRKWKCQRPLEDHGKKTLSPLETEWFFCARIWNVQTKLPSDPLWVADLEELRCKIKTTPRNVMTRDETCIVTALCLSTNHLCVNLNAEDLCHSSWESFPQTTLALALWEQPCRIFSFKTSDLHIANLRAIGQQRVAEDAAEQTADDHRGSDHLSSSVFFRWVSKIKLTQRYTKCQMMSNEKVSSFGTFTFSWMCSFLVRTMFNSFSSFSSFSSLLRQEWPKTTP